VPSRHRERGGVAVPLRDLGARRFSATHQPLYPWERDPVPIVQDAGWTGLDGSKNSCPPWGLNSASSSLQQVTILNELCTDSVCSRTVETRVIPSQFWNWLWSFLVVLKSREVEFVSGLTTGMDINCLSKWEKHCLCGNHYPVGM